MTYSNENMPKSRQKKRASARRNTGSKRGSSGLLTQASSSAVFSRHVPPSRWLANNVSGLPRFRKLVLAWNNNAGHSVGTGTFYEFPCILNTAYLPGLSSGSGNFNNSKNALAYGSNIAQYNNCTVIGARWHAWINIAPQVGYEYTTMSNTATVGCTVNNTSTPLVGSQLAIEQGMSQATFLGNSPDTVHFTDTLDIAKWFDVKDLLDNPAQFASTASTIPNQLVYLHIWCGNDRAGNTIGFNVMATVEFECIFNNPVPFSST